MRLMRNRIFVLVALLGACFTANAQPTQAANKTDANGKKNGPWEKHDDKGNLLYKGQFNHGHPTGQFVYFFKDGKVKAVLNYHNNGNSAYATIFYPTDSLMAVGKYVQEKRDSTWKFFDQDGNLRSEEYYQNGKHEGTTRVYFDDGSVAELVTYHNDVKNGPWKRYYKDGKLQMDANVVEGIKYQGQFTTYYPNGNKETDGLYIDGERDSTWYFYNENGSVYTVRYYTNGKVIKEYPQNGDFDSYFPSGIPRNEYHYKDGKKNGPYKIYYHMGHFETDTARSQDPEMPNSVVQKLVGSQVKEEGQYKHGQLDGQVIYYATDGEIDSTATYKNGEKVNP